MYKRKRYLMVVVFLLPSLALAVLPPAQSGSVGQANPLAGISQIPSLGSVNVGRLFGNSSGPTQESHIVATHNGEVVYESHIKNGEEEEPSFLSKFMGPLPYTTGHSGIGPGVNGNGLASMGLMQFGGIGSNGILMSQSAIGRMPITYRLGM